MSGDNVVDPENGRLFGAETQHMIPMAIKTDPRALDGRLLLQGIGFDLEARANKKLLLVNPSTRDAILAAPQSVQNVFRKAGFGFNTHDSRQGNHAGYTEFSITALNQLALDANNKQWDNAARERAVFDFVRFMDYVNGDGHPPVYGTGEQGFLAAWNDFKSPDYAKLDPDKFRAIDAFKAAADMTPVDAASNRNSEFRYLCISRLLDEARSILTPGEIESAFKLLAEASAGGGNPGHASAALVSLIHDLAARSATPNTSLEAFAENTAAKFYDFAHAKNGGIQLGALIDTVTGVLNELKKHGGRLEDSLKSLGEGAIGAMGKSLHSMLVGLSGSAIGDMVEFLNIAYEPLKKGLKTGDWSDMRDAMVKYGAAAIVGAVLVIGSTAIAAAIAGPVAAAFVGAGWTAYGLYEAVTNGAELIGKISADLSEVIAKIGNTIEEASRSAGENIALLNRIVANTMDVDFKEPIFTGGEQGNALARKYLLDSLDDILPASVVGTEQNERFYGKNNSVVDGGAGNDEIYVRHTSQARGGEGNDIVVGGAARTTPAGQPIDPINPNSKRAEKDLSLTLDGGEGNDWVVSVGGEGATTAGGLGRDWIFNSSNGGVIYGDTVSGYYDKPVVDKAGNLVLDASGKPITVPTPVEDIKENSDNIWFSANTVMMDAQKHDVLKFYGLPMTGGNAEGGLGGLIGFGSVGGAIGLANFYNSLDKNGKYDPALSIYTDHLLPWMTYAFRREKSGAVDMYVTNQFDQLFTALSGQTASDAYKAQKALDAKGILNGWMKIKNVDIPYSFLGTQQFKADNAGTFNMVFKAPNPLANLLSIIAPLAGAIGFAAVAGLGGLSAMDQALTLAAAVSRFAKGVKWAEAADPLIIDLDGDGIETTGIASGNVYFDVDGDLFAERSGWLKGDDGFLVHDLNGNGRIDDISEMFGGVGRSGIEQLAKLDSNGDGKITRADVLWSELKIWQDVNGDGVTDAGELKTLEEVGIVSLDLNARALDILTPQGARLTSSADVTFDGGAVRRMFDAVLASNDTDTKFSGEAGHAVWQSATTLDLKGFGRITNLSVAAANDIGFSNLVSSTAAAMTVPNFRTLVSQVGSLLGAWGETLEQTRELTPVLVGVDSAGRPVLLDHGMYKEDAQGGYWTLASRNAITDAYGTPIVRATLQDVLAQAVASGAAWRIEQTWSPSERSQEVTAREAAPYLMRVENGRAVVLDYGVKQVDGTWKLASDTATIYANKADILSLAHAAGTEWRTEALGFNRYADLPVDRIGVRFTDGIAVDYTVRVTDQDGTFYVWARNLDRAIQLEWKTGDSREFKLRNYAIDFDSLDEVNSTDESTYRVEMLTPAQFHFAVSLGGIDFRSEMLTAQINNATGHISYAVGPTGSANLSTDPVKYTSGIAMMIDMLQPVMEQYILTSRRMAVRLAAQGGLKDFFAGVTYDVVADMYKPTTNRELAPMFEAIFRGAPASNADDAVLDYLTNWNAILNQIYPDYHPSGEGNLAGSTLKVDQAFILQMILSAFETISLDLDIRGVAHALGISEERIVTHAATDTIVDGTDGTDYFYSTKGDQTLRGGKGADYYFIGRDFGNDIVNDKDFGASDELRFTNTISTDVIAIRDGEDLILQILGRTNSVRLTDQFLGERNEMLTNGKRADSGVNAIVFADGVVWDRFRMSMEVVDKERAAGLFNDSLIGSGSADVLWGGKGNDYMSGGAGGDIYVFQRGDGQDIIDDLGNFSFGPVKAGIDILTFKGGIASKDLKLIRDGESANLKIVILDNEGNATSDTIEVVGQFGGVRPGLGMFAELMDSSDGLDYVAPNLIERFVFDDGSSLDFGQIVEQVLKNAKTRADDAIFGMLNNNTLDGGAGNDFLSGKGGDDTYIFGSGYGRDVIIDNAIPGIFEPPQRDKLKFIDEIRWTDLDFLRDGPTDTLRMRIKGTTDEIVLQDFLDQVPIFGFLNLIEDIQFGDGTTWTGFKLAQHYIDIAKTVGNDTIYGYDELSDYLDGGAGDDRLIGFGGNDVYRVAIGDGNDTILDSSGNDQLILEGIASTDVDFSRTALDLIFTVRSTGQRFVLENQYVRDDAQTFAVETLVFTDRTVSFMDINPEDIDLVGTTGDDVISGSNFAETLDGREGNDTLFGGDGGDSYKFDAGYGQDVIIDRRMRASWNDRRGVRIPVDDIVLFGGGITRDNIVFTKDGTDLLISITGRTDTLRIRNQFRDAEDGVELFKFHDGSTIKISDVEELLQIAGGNRGDNILTGLPNQENVLDGRQGDDTLHGGNKADTYSFSAGYGFDRIIEKADASSVIDRVVFGASVRLEDIVITRNANDLMIDLGNGVDVLTVVNGLSTTRVEQFEFADGRILSIDLIIDRMLMGTAADDHLIGFDNRNDTLSGGAGSDALEGGLGNDTYKFGLGDGSDSVHDSGGVDKVVFGAGVTRDLVQFRNIDGDLLITIGDGADRLVILSGYSARPVESFVFVDGTTLSIEGVRGIIRDGMSNAGQDRVDLRELPLHSTLRPGAGNDRLILAQDSRAVIRAQEGIDSVEMPSGVTSATVVVEGYASNEAYVRPASVGSSDLVITFPSGGQLVVKGALGSGDLPNIEFSNGVVWDAAALVQAAVMNQESAGNDIIAGSRRADTLIGGPGDDALSGGAGDDTYSFTRGDGRDVIDDTAGNDTLKITGYRPDELRVSQIDPARQELVLSFADSTDQIVLRYTAGWNGVDSARFSDGTTFTLDQLRDMAASVGTWQDDRIVGSARDEVFHGGAGDDVIIGGGGDDIYRFARGDGHDRIESDGVTDGKGTLVFAAGIALEDVVATRDRDGNIVLSINGSDDRVTLVDSAGDIDSVIAKVLFSDGRSLTYRNIAALIAPTDGDDHVIVPSDIANPAIGSQIFGGLGNDTIECGRGADVITGGKGDDRLEAGSGADIYYFSRGDGQDTISDVEIVDASKTDKVRFGAGIAPADIRFLSVGPADIVIGIVGTDDRLTLKDMFRSETSATDYGIEQFEFADGTVWQLSDIYANAAASTDAGNDAIDFGRQIDITATLNGGVGDDVLAGGVGDTTYVFGRGYGRDVIREETNWTGSFDTVRITSGIAPADVMVVRNGSDFVLRLVGSDDGLTIVGQGNASAPPIDVVRFNNGTQWTAADLAARALTPEAAERALNSGHTASDPFQDPLFAVSSGPRAGAPSTSTIGLAQYGTQTIALPGFTAVGSATALGDGAYQLTPDSANKSGAVWAAVDLTKNVVWTTKIFFGAKESGAAGVSFSLQNAGTNALASASTNMGALVSGSFGIQFDTASLTTNFSQFVLNGNVSASDLSARRNYARLEDAVWHDVVITWDAASTTITYSVDGVSIDSKSYDVVRNLFGGDATIWYGFGGATNYYYSNEQRVKLISVASTGPTGVDVATIGTVNHIGSGLFSREIAGGAKRNTYDVFVPLSRWGDGVDVITNFQSGDAGDTLNINIAQGLLGSLVARAVGADTLIYFVPKGAAEVADARPLVRLVSVAPETLTSINFDGGAFSVLSNLTKGGGATIEGGLGDDTLYGDERTNLLSGGGGNDRLEGASGNDTLTGGRGNDFLRGGSGNDTYRFNLGDGQDTISDWDDGVDTIEFGAGISVEDVVVTQVSSGSHIDLVLSIAGSEDRITIERGVNAEYNRIEQFRFADGSTRSYAEFFALATTLTSNNDVFYGDERANVLSGGGGNDRLEGASGNDTLTGGRGNDFLRGGSGNDTYRFNLGDGQDTISDWDDGVDTIEFGAGINVEDVIVTQVSSGSHIDLVLSIAGSEDRITIERGVSANYNRIEQFHFADGSTRSYAEFFALASTPTSNNDVFYGDERANVLSGGGGNDRLEGESGNDTLTGGRGNDFLRGGSGNDTYRFNLGDGQDTISDWGYDVDTVEFGAGIAAEDVVVTQVNRKRQAETVQRA